MDTEYKVQKIADSIKQSTVLIVLNETLGGGTVLTPDGYILTCEHIANSKDVLVVFVNEDATNGYPAHMIAGDKTRDIAIIKVNPGFQLHAATLAHRMPIVGERGVLVSHPYLCYWTTTIGWVNAIRKVNHHYMFQSDATGSDGSSGGGFYNLDGEFLGMLQYKIVREAGARPDADLNMFYPITELTRPENDIMKTIEISRRVEKQD